MSGTQRWVLASTNRGKAAELEALLAAAGYGAIRLTPQSELGIASAPEEAATFIENALVKARHAALASGLPAIADDSGLMVDALGGAPGLRSARFAGTAATDKDNNAKLLAALADTPLKERNARFVCAVVVLRSADDPAPSVGVGEWPGRIALAPRGEQGFGYDPLFFDPELGRTAAELEPEEKNRISHRGRALRALVMALGAGRR